MGAWGKIMVALVLVLIPSPFQCLISCAARMHQAAAPGAASCHHRQKDSGSQTTPCSQESVVTAQGQSPLQLVLAAPAGVFLPVAFEDGRGMVATRGELSASDSPPPGCVLFVLRI